MKDLTLAEKLSNMSKSKSRSRTRVSANVGGPQDRGKGHNKLASFENDISQTIENKSNALKNNLAMMKSRMSKRRELDESQIA